MKRIVLLFIIAFLSANISFSQKNGNETYSFVSLKLKDGSFYKADELKSYSVSTNGDFTEINLIFNTGVIKKLKGKR